MTISNDLTREQVMFFLSDLVGGKGKKKPKLLGLILMLVAGMFLTLGNSLFQFIEMRSPTHVSSSAMLVIRCFIQLVLSIAFMAYGKVHIYGQWKKYLFPLITMGITEVCVIVFMYEAIERMPVGDATVLQFTAPVFTTLLSFACIKGKLSWFDILFGIASFTGVLFIAKPDLFFPAKISVIKVLQSGNHNISTVNNTMMTKTIVYNLNYLEGAAFAIAAAFSLSCFFILNKVYGKVDVILTIFYPSVAGMIIGPFVFLIRKETVSSITEIEGMYWGLFLVIGFTSFIGLMLLGESLQLVDPVPAILVRNCDVIFVYCFQYLLVRITPSFSSGIGTVIILGCTTLIALNHSYSWDKKCCGNSRCGGEEELDESDDEEIQLQLLNDIEEEEEILR